LITAGRKLKTPPISGEKNYETEDTLMAEYGSTSRVACIGPSGEKVSLIAGIMTDHGAPPPAPG